MRKKDKRGKLIILAKDFFRSARRARRSERSVPKYVSTESTSSNAAMRKKDKQEGGDKVGTGDSSRKRKFRKRSKKIQTLLRARRCYVRIAQKGALRKTERKAEEKIRSGKEKSP
jgi:hypothetical protein